MGMMVDDDIRSILRQKTSNACAYYHTRQSFFGRNVVASATAISLLLVGPSTTNTVLNVPYRFCCFLSRPHSITLLSSHQNSIGCFDGVTVGLRLYLLAVCGSTSCIIDIKTTLPKLQSVQLLHRCCGLSTGYRPWEYYSW
jgi:hypothetical protein